MTPLIVQDIREAADQASRSHAVELFCRILTFRLCRVHRLHGVKAVASTSVFDHVGKERSSVRLLLGQAPASSRIDLFHHHLFLTMRTSRINIDLVKENDEG